MAAPAATAPAATVPAAPGSGRVRVVVSVDWEGAFLSDDGLDALDGFHSRFPEVPLTHFISAGYFTKPGADKKSLAEGIARSVATSDEVALHIHCWKSLVSAAGVVYRDAPSFIRPELMAFPDGDAGFEIELGAYTPDEVRKIVRTSMTLLGEAGLTVKPLFRAGGWMAPKDVLGAVRAEGFLIDSSSTDAAWLDNDIPDAALPARVRAVWPAIDQTSQPYVIETSAGSILELPMTGGLADYASAAELAGHIRRALAELARSPDRDVFVHIGFHQETADVFAGRVEQAITEVRKEAGSALVFETSSATADAARRALAPGAR